MIVTWIKLKPEISQIRASTTKTQVEAAVAADAHEQKVLQNIIEAQIDRKSTRLNSSHVKISYAVFCLKKKTNYTDRMVLQQTKQQTVTSCAVARQSL